MQPPLFHAKNMSHTKQQYHALSSNYIQMCLSDKQEFMTRL